MQQNEIVERINQLLSDEEYVNHLCSLGSPEAVSKELESKDVDISPDELRKIYKLIKRKSKGELSEEELEEIAGGSSSIQFQGTNLPMSAFINNKNLEIIEGC